MKRLLAGSVGRIALTAIAVAACRPALAEEAGHAAKPGMPQLDPAVFVPQLFWLAVTFAALYFLMRHLALPRVAEVLDQREQRIQIDLDKAEKLKLDADEALATYQKMIADARAKAQAELRDAAAAIAAETAKREAAFAARLAERTRAAEESIAAAKQRAMAELPQLAADVAGTVLAKVAGITPPQQQLLSAIEAARRERA